MIKLLLLFVLNTVIPVSNAETLNSGQIFALKKTLFQNYTFDTIPTANDEPLNLTISLAVRAFSNIDQKEGTVELNIWLRYWWKDHNLQWNRTQWNISSLVIGTDPSLLNPVWTPDIYLYNTAETPLENMKYSNVLVSHTGDIMWSRPGMIKSTCGFDLSNFPYDRQHCYIKLGSWSYTGYHLVLSKGNPGVDLENYQDNEEWSLESVDTNVNRLRYNCCPDEYYDITFDLYIKRYSGYYENNIIIPTFATASLILITLLIPWESGERISFAITVMLSLIVFLLLLSDNLPKSNQNPLLSRMITMLTFFSLFGVFFTVLISALNDYNKNGLKNKETITNPLINKIFNICKYVTCSKDNCRHPKSEQLVSSDRTHNQSNNEAQDSFDIAIRQLSVNESESQRSSINDTLDLNRSYSYKLANNVIYDKQETLKENINNIELSILETTEANMENQIDTNINANIDTNINANIDANIENQTTDETNKPEELSPLQKECKTLITIVERVYSIIFLLAFVSLCIFMIISSYN